MGQILTSTVRHSSAWYGKDLAHDTSWIVKLEPRHLAEIASAVASITRRGLSFEDWFRPIVAELAQWRIFPPRPGEQYPTHQGD